MTVISIRTCDSDRSTGTLLCKAVADGDNIYLEGKQKQKIIRVPWDVVLREVELAKEIEKKHGATATCP